MNSRDQEQVRIYRRYLIEIAEQPQSRLLRDQVRRWLERSRAGDWALARAEGSVASAAAVPGLLLLGYADGEAAISGGSAGGSDRRERRFSAW